MRQIIYAIMALVVFSGHCFAIYQLELPEEIPPLIELETRDLKTGELMGTATMTISRVNGDRAELLAVEARAWAKVKDEKYQQTSETLYDIKNGCITIRSQKIDATLGGKELFSSLIDFDWIKHRATSLFKDMKKNEEKCEDVDLDKKTMLVGDLSFFTTGMISKGKKEDTANVILPGGKVFKAMIKVDYEPEEITIAGQQISAYPSTVTFDLGLFSIFSPRLKFWFMADLPHFFLRYSGPGAGPGSPQIVQEVVNL